MIIPIKQILLEGTLQNIINSVKTKFNYFRNKFKYLNDKEFDTLLEVLYGWYYLNYKFPDDLEKKEPEIIKLFEKIKINNTQALPNKLYRGLTFATKKDLNNFLKDAEKTNLINGKIFRLDKDTRFTAWTSSKEVAKTFLPGGANSNQDRKYGILLTTEPKQLENKNILFSMTFLLHNEDEVKDFMKLVLKNEYNKNLSYVKNNPYKKLSGKTMFGYQHGTLFSITEDEFILSNVPFNKCKIELKEIL